LFHRLLIPTCDDRKNLGLGGDLAVNGRYALHFLDSASDPHGRYLEPKGVAGNDRASELGFIESAEKRDLIFPVLELAKHQNRSDLGECLDLQDAGHNGNSGEMTLKEMFIRGHLFDPDDADPRFQFDDPVHKKERVPVRQNILDSD
jgi:hypothetical protein